MFSDKITKLVAEDAKKVVAGRVKQSAEQGAMVNSGTPEPAQSTPPVRSSTPPVRPTASSNDIVLMGGQGRGNVTGKDLADAEANIKRGVAAVGRVAKKSAKAPAIAASRVGRMVAQGVTRIFKGRGS